MDFADRMMYGLLQALPPEGAHDLGKWAMRHRMMAPGPVTLDDASAPRLFGQKIPNPLGLAAGFDKNAQIVDAAIDYGFGFVEVGSVTYRGGPGNPKPRMFRLDQQTIMNRMGLNGDPAEVVASRLKQVKTPYFGVNIAKTHSPDILGDAAIEDICGSFKILQEFGIYTAINVSCPNTREGRTFEDPAPLKELLSALTSIRDTSGRVGVPAHQVASLAEQTVGEYAHATSTRPLLVKLSPVLDPGEETGKSRFEQVLAVCEEAKVDGYICCNTLPVDHPKFGKGGVSGHVIRFKAWRMCQFIADNLKRPVIGCGGVYLPEDLAGYLKRGCTAVQVYNGFVRGPLAGTRFAHRILEKR